MQYKFVEYKEKIQHSDSNCINFHEKKINN